MVILTLLILGLKYCGKLQITAVIYLGILSVTKMFYHFESWGQCYKTFYRGNLLPFYGIYRNNNVL